MLTNNWKISYLINSQYLCRFFMKLGKWDVSSLQTKQGLREKILASIAFLKFNESLTLKIPADVMSRRNINNNFDYRLKKYLYYP